MTLGNKIQQTLTMGKAFPIIIFLVRSFKNLPKVNFTNARFYKDKESNLEMIELINGEKFPRPHGNPQLISFMGREGYFCGYSSDGLCWLTVDDKELKVMIEEGTKEMNHLNQSLQVVKERTKDEKIVEKQMLFGFGAFMIGVVFAFLTWYITNDTINNNYNKLYIATTDSIAPLTQELSTYNKIQIANYYKMTYEEVGIPKPKPINSTNTTGSGPSQEQTGIKILPDIPKIFGVVII